MELARLTNPEDNGEPERLADFAKDCLSLDTDEFIRRQGNGFLVHHGPIGSLTAPLGPQRTIAVEAPANHSGSPLEQDFVVFRVRRTERSAFPNFISVGRTKNNDIVVADVSLSKFHAFFREDGEHMLIQDAGSRNGTFVNEVSVATKANGDPAEVETGAVLRFGSVEMTFFRAAAFCELVKRLSR
jgi:hypothetical protein